MRPAIGEDCGPRGSTCERRTDRSVTMGTMLPWRKTPEKRFFRAFSAFPLPRRHSSLETPETIRKGGIPTRPGIPTSTSRQSHCRPRKRPVVDYLDSIKLRTGQEPYPGLQRLRRFSDSGPKNSKSFRSPQAMPMAARGWCDFGRCDRPIKGRSVRRENRIDRGP